LILPALRELFDQLARHEGFAAAVSAVRHPAPSRTSLTGLNLTAQAIYAVLLHRLTERPVLLVAESSAAAEVLVETAGAVYGLLFENPARAAPLLLPAHDVTPYDGLSPHADISERRGIGLWRLADGSASIVAAPIASALLKTAKPDFVRNLAWRIEAGDEFFLEDLEQGIAAAGYVRNEPVEMVGQFSVRGGILDVFSPETPAPVRIEMFGDQVESIREFDPETQKSVSRVDQTLLLPLTEQPVSQAAPDAALGPGWEFAAELLAQRQSTLLDLVQKPLIVWAEPKQLQARAEELAAKLEEAYAAQGGDGPPPAASYLSLEELEKAAAAADQIRFDQLGLAAGGWESFEIRSQRTPKFQGNIAQAVQEMQARIRGGSRALVAASSLGDVERLADIFNEYGVTYQLGLAQGETKELSPYLQERAYLAGPAASAIVVQAAIGDGVNFPDAGVVVYGNEDVFSTSELVARPEKRRSAASTFLSDLQDLKPGDFVVHVEHGVGRFLGMTKVEQGPRQEELMAIEYAGNAKLYVPLSRLDLVQKHHGAGGRPPSLDRMGGQTWERAKSRVKARLVDMADELLKLYAERKTARGFAFSPDGEWQREFEDSFKHTPTRDQISAVEDVKKDMESTLAMDRLICGDVGFGKTEVAMRAAFKALGDDKQVAVLAPTTVLSFQHY
jgi:transcription-repair coupling factor (superfamily II helicase)